MMRLKFSWLLILVGLGAALLEELRSNQSRQTLDNRNGQNDLGKVLQDLPHNECKRTHVVDPLVTQPSAHDKQWQDDQKSYWRRQILISKWLNWITGIAAAIALGGLYFVYLQAFSARVAAESSAEQVTLMKESMKLTERAWVGVTDKVMLTFQTDKPMKAKVVLQNTGKTPAVKCVTHGKIVQVNERWTKERFESFRDPDGPQLGIAMTPNADVRSLFNGPIPNIEQIRTGKAFVYFFGRITYLDIFDKPHFTKFCGIYDMDENAFVNCGEYSDAN
jgi:hypothetical protein